MKNQLTEIKSDNYRKKVQIEHEMLRIQGARK